MRLSIVGWDGSYQGLTDEIVHSIQVISGKYVGDIAAANYLYPDIEVTTDPREAIRYKAVDGVVIISGDKLRLAAYGILLNKKVFVVDEAGDFERRLIDVISERVKVSLSVGKAAEVVVWVASQ